MNTEEKAKAYDDALERAKAYYNELHNCRAKDELESIFPELRESEDERIRKEIIEYLKLVDKGEEDYAHPMVSGWIAWLEKQKEQKELPLMDGNADLYFDEWNQQEQNPTKRQCFEEGMRYAERLQKEQKHYWKPTETDVALFNKAVITNKALTPTERAQLDIIRSKFGYCRTVNCN